MAVVLEAIDMAPLAMPAATGTNMRRPASVSMFWLTESMPAIVAIVIPVGASAESWAAEYCGDEHVEHRIDRPPGEIEEAREVAFQQRRPGLRNRKSGKTTGNIA
jgi:hypothetical protein